MPGTFSKSNRPILPGVYINWETVQPAPTPVNLGSTVALVFTHDWGPFKEATEVRSFAEFQTVFGSDLSPGAIAVNGAFRGEGTEGRGGAGSVICYRYGGSAAAKATKSLNNATPVAALTLTARYQGARGNALKVAVVDTPGAAGTNDLILYDGTVELERYTHADTDITALAAAINANSQWVTATSSVTGVALWSGAFTTNATPSALTGGNDGTTVTGTDVSDAYTALEVQHFSILAFDNITPGVSAIQEAANLAGLVAWATGLNASGKRFMVVAGGAGSEVLADATTRATAIRAAGLVGAQSYAENIVNLGIGSYSDSTYGTVSTSQLAPRLAGILAQRGEVDSVTFARLAGLEVLTGPTAADKLAAYKAGVMTIGRDSNAVAPTRLEKQATSYTSITDPKKPYTIFRNPKFVRTMQGIENEFGDWLAITVIGKAVVNNKTRDAVRAELLARLNLRATANIIQSKPTVEVDQDPAPSDDDEFLAYVIGLAFGRSAEQVYLSIRNR